jgi:hypothetical protein
MEQLRRADMWGVPSMRSFALAALVASALTAPAQAVAATVDANDVVSVPTRDVDVERLSRDRAIITLDGAAGHALIVSTDRREKTQAMKLERFEQRFSKNLGLGRSPRMRIATHGKRGSFTGYKVSRVRYDAGDDALVVLAKSAKRSKHTISAARTATDSNQSVSFARSFGSAPAPLNFTYLLTQESSFVTTVYGNGYGAADLAVVLNDSAVVDSVTLTALVGEGSLCPCQLDGSNSIGLVYALLLGPQDVYNPGQLTVQVAASLDRAGVMVPLNAYLVDYLP